MKIAPTGKRRGNIEAKRSVFTFGWTPSWNLETTQTLLEPPQALPNKALASLAGLPSATHSIAHFLKTVNGL